VPSISISRSSALVLASLLLAALVVAGPRLARTGAATTPDVAAAPLEPVASAPSKRALVVHVVGAVRRPGLFRLREGARVADAVARAGGATRRADLAALNLAAPLVDGTQVLVPPRAKAASAASGESGAGEVAGGTAAAPAISLSSATADELDQLPGVGPVTAQKIIDYRTAHGPFGSVDDLDAVPGIGPARLEQLRDLVTP
jgi:competence protein ComEA